MCKVNDCVFGSIRAVAGRNIKAKVSGFGRRSTDSAVGKI